QHKQPTPLKELNPTVPDDLIVVVERLMQKNPASRFGSCAELIGVLRGQLGQQQAVPARRATMQMPRARLPRPEAQPAAAPAGTPTGRPPPTPSPLPSLQLSTRRTNITTSILPAITGSLAPTPTQTKQPITPASRASLPRTFKKSSPPLRHPTRNTPRGGLTR